MLSKVTQHVSKARFSTVPAYFYTPATEVTKLANGAKVATEATAGETATVTVYVKGGSRSEASGYNGSGFSLTKIAQEGKVNQELSKLGASLKVTNEREKIGFSTTVLKNDLPKALELLAAAAKGTTVDDASVSALQKKLPVYADKFNSNYEAFVFDELVKTAFMGTPLSNSVAPVENINNLTANCLKTFANNNYAGSNIVVSVAGNVEHKAVAELANKNFGDASTTNNTTSPAVFTGSDYRVRYDSMKKANIAFGYKTEGAASEQYIPLKIMENIISQWNAASLVGKNTTNRLAATLAEQDIVHSYKAFNLNFTDAGLFGVHLVAPENKLDDAMYYTLDNLVRLVHNVSEEELDLAKQHLVASFVYSNNVAEQLVNFDRVVSIAELTSRVKAITLADIKKVANDVINDEDHALAALGPIYELPDYNWIRRRSFYQRY